MAFLEMILEDWRDIIVESADTGVGIATTVESVFARAGLRGFTFCEKT
jgi:hypothetical protein